jgi:hypothetical protein
MGQALWESAQKHSLSLDVQLLYQPLGVVSGVTHWISEEAMHIDTGRVTLQRQSEVEITFPCKRNNRTAYHRILAHVSHCMEGGSTLQFLSCSREAHCALRELISQPVGNA